MSRKVLINYLELAYSPICNYDFSLIKEDEYFQSLTSNSNIYIISQRNELTFEELTFEFVDKYQIVLHCEIRQKENNKILKCKLPIYQSNLANDIEKEIRFHFEYALPKPNPMPREFPQYNIRNLLFSYHDGTFIGWISPENLIQNYLNGALEAEISGSVDEFIIYKVHYVGKATEQKVWKRLTGHSTLQDILSIEYPLHYGSLPTHEIAILFFKFKDAIKMHTITPKDEIDDDIIDTLLYKNFPSPKTILLDAEKALIHAMQPKYNKEFYKNYPLSKDGLHKYSYDTYTFKIQSNIILEYNNGTIGGSSDMINGDSIIIEKNKPLRILKANNLSHKFPLSRE